MYSKIAKALGAWIVVLLYMCIIFQFESLAAEVVIGVAPGEEIAPVQERPKSAELDGYLPEDLQNYIWELTGERGLTQEGRIRYYAALIGLCEGESTFKQKAQHYNAKNDTCDYGLFQINTKKVSDLKKLGVIGKVDDIYDPYVNAKAGEYIFWTGYKETGYSEQCYTRYLYGDKKERSNKYTQRVWKMMQKWYGKMR